MSLIVISVIKLLLLPPNVLLLTILGGLFFYKRKAGMRVALLSLLLLVVLSFPYVTNKLAVAWERVPVLQFDRMAEFLPQAIVVIGGGLERVALEYGGEWTVNPRTLVRLRYAAKLARETGLPVMVSGGGVSDTSDIDEAKIMASVLMHEFSIPVEWQENASRNTAENARLSRNILKQSGVDRIMLVTHAYHMPRAELEFRKAGFQVLPAPTAFIGSSGIKNASGYSLVDWLPTVRVFEDVFLLSHEAFGMLWYRFRY